MKILNGFMLLIFTLCVAVQYNDPDPLPWMFMYGLACIACVAYFTPVNHVGIPLLVCALALIWACALLPLVVMTDEPLDWTAVFMQTTMKTQVVEWVREIGGLLIVVAWMLVLFVLQKKKNKAVEG